MRAAERGFTIIEILIALVVFAIIALGAIAALGFTTNSGYHGALPTSLTTVRSGRDFTAASTYLQTLEEYAANKGYAAAGADSTYTISGPAAGTPCSGSLTGGPAGWTDAPCPENESYQLDWETLAITIEEWNWDQTNKQYCQVGDTGCLASASEDAVKLVQATLTWKLSDKSTSLTVKRFLAECASNWPATFCVP